jgi:putative nucleotidyltransferase with HDIG domain
MPLLEQAQTRVPPTPWSRRRASHRDAALRTGPIPGPVAPEADDRSGAADADEQMISTLALLAAMAARDEPVFAHSHTVASTAEAVGRAMDFDDDDLRDLHVVALLHDVGKLMMPEPILQQRGPLDDEQWATMRTHTACGAAILENIPALAPLAPAVRATHERWDGGGYPDNLAGDEIPLTSRIVFVCDAWDAMLSDRPYRRALSPEEARAELLANAGTQFCAKATQSLLEVVA